MDIEEIIDNLSLITVIPDYAEGRMRGLTDTESEEIAFEAIPKAIDMLDKLESELQWVYGRLNMISQIIEDGRNYKR